MSFTEIALILFVALVLFGPEDLPVIARTLGKIFYQVRSYANELTKEFKEAIDTPGNILNEAFSDPLKDNKKDDKRYNAQHPQEKEQTNEHKEDNSEDLLSYEETEKSDDTKKDNAEESNPLLDLPQDMVSRPNDK